MSEIQEFYSGKTILITGATGLIGKVLLERMLDTLPDVKKIYLLLRPKKGLTPQQRLGALLSHPIFTFNNIPSSQLKKVNVINADVTMEKFGLSNENREILINEVSIVIHGAANIRFDLPLKDAIIQNTLPTKYLLELCAEIKKLVPWEVILLQKMGNISNEILKSVVYISTTYCNIDIANCDEKVYDIKGFNPYEILRMVDDGDKLNQIEKKVIEPHPNTYTFSKRLAEIIARDMGAELPLSILRPSIVIASRKKPIQGWIDSLSGPVGILFACGTGVLRIIYADDTCKPDVVPVDCVANAVIVAAWQGNSYESTEVPIFNVTVLEENKLDWQYITSELRSLVQKYPLKRMLWYPRGFGTTNYFYYVIWTMICQFLPAYVIDTLLIIFGQKPFLVKVQKRLWKGIQLVAYFTMNNFTFVTTNAQKLFRQLNETDRLMFYSVSDLTIEDYSLIKTYFCGREFCLHDNGKGRGRYVLLNILFLLDLILQGIVYYGLVYLILYFFNMTNLIALN